MTDGFGAALRDPVRNTARASTDLSEEDAVYMMTFALRQFEVARSDGRPGEGLCYVASVIRDLSAVMSNLLLERQWRAVMAWSANRELAKLGIRQQ